MLTHLLGRPGPVPTDFGGNRVGFFVPPGTATRWLGTGIRTAEPGSTTPWAAPAPAEVTKALDCLTKRTNCGSYATHGTWPALRGLMRWSVNWDRYSNWEFQRDFDAYFG